MPSVGPEVMEQITFRAWPRLATKQYTRFTDSRMRSDNWGRETSGDLVT